MVGYDFIYNRISLRDSGYMIVRSEEKEDFGLARTVLREKMTPNNSIRTHYGTKYNDVLILHFFITKNMLKDYVDININMDELRGLLRWLTSPKFPQSLFVESYGQENNVEYVGLFTDVVPFETGHLNGLKLTFTCDSQYAYKMEQRKIVCNDNEKGITKTIYCDTDEQDDVVCPKITIIPTREGIVSITNEKTQETMKLSLDLSHSKYIIDCKHRYISGDGKALNIDEVGWDKSILLNQGIVNADAFKMYWLELHAGMNKLCIKGYATVIFEYREPMKVGGFIN